MLSPEAPQGLAIRSPESLPLPAQGQFRNLTLHSMQEEAFPLIPNDD